MPSLRVELGREMHTQLSWAPASTECESHCVSFSSSLQLFPLFFTFRRWPTCFLYLDSRNILEKSPYPYITKLTNVSPPASFCLPSFPPIGMKELSFLVAKAKLFICAWLPSPFSSSVTLLLHVPSPSASAVLSFLLDPSHQHTYML